MLVDVVEFGLASSTWASSRSTSWEACTSWESSTSWEACTSWESSSAFRGTSSLLVDSHDDWLVEGLKLLSLGLILFGGGLRMTLDPLLVALDGTFDGGLVLSGELVLQLLLVEAVSD